MLNEMNKMFGKIEPGMCRLTMNGGIAVKTANGYRSYNVKTGRLTNCENFVFNIGEEFFFLIPTNKVAKGDIILASGKPKCVIEVNKDKITVVSYEDSTIEMIIPERHMFMGNTYFYGKIVSMFGSDILKGKGGTKNIMKYMMLSEIMKGGNGGSMSNMLPLMMMGGGMSDMFGDLLDSDDDDTDEEETNNESEAE